jgi:hypothetical protein
MHYNSGIPHQYYDFSAMQICYAHGIGPHA